MVENEGAVNFWSLVFMSNEYRNLAEEYASKQEGYYEMSRPEMLRFIPEGIGSLLDVGCSSGAFGAMVKKTIPGCKVWGIEPDEKAAATAAKRLDQVVNSAFSIEIKELEGERFDAVCFNDVLEHLPNPEKILKELHNILNETGVVIASIPNILHFYQITKILLEQDWRYEETGIMDKTHLRFFTRKSIIRMFEETGYKVEEITGICPSFGLKYRIANAFTLGMLVDWKFVQFAIRARVNV